MIKEIDLTGTSVNGELRLGSENGQKPTNWVGQSRMVLRNTTIGVIQDAHEWRKCWPASLELDGFTYRRLGGAASMGSRSSAWFAKWLMYDETYSPQPYEQLAKVLRQMGYPRKADDVLYAGRKREHYQAFKEGECLRWYGLGLLRWTIGFGIGSRYFRSVFWVLFFTMIGAFVLGEVCPTLKCDELAQRTIGLYDLLWASFDQILPIVSLDKMHEKLMTASSLPSWARYYFYGQKLVGWALGSFLIAGLGGLTQKS